MDLLIGLVFLLPFFSAISAVCDLDRAEACYSTFTAQVVNDEKDKFCQTANNPALLRQCVSSNLTDCSEADRNTASQSFEGTLLAGQLACTPGCEKASEQTQTLGMCALKFAKKMTQAQTDGKDLGQICGDYKTMVECIDDAVGECQLLRGKIQEQAGEYMGIMDSHCADANSGTTMASSEGYKIHITRETFVLLLLVAVLLI